MIGDLESPIAGMIDFLHKSNLLIIKIIAAANDAISTLYKGGVAVAHKAAYSRLHSLCISGTR